MKLAIAFVVLFFASVAQAQTVVTANPTAISFGTLYPTDFDTQTIVYTCATGPCVGAAPKITGGHAIVVSNNTCKANWTFFVPGQTGDTCSVSWTLKATNAEANCPENVCTGTVGISVTNGVSSDAVVASDGYTATVFSANPRVTISPKSINWGEIPDVEDQVGPNPVTITNVSEVNVNVTYCIDQPPFGNLPPDVDPPANGLNFSVNEDGTGPSCQATTRGTISLLTGGSATLGLWFFVDLGYCARPQGGCLVPASGTLKIWSTSTTPGASTKTYFEGAVKLFGISQYPLE